MDTQGSAAFFLPMREFLLKFSTDQTAIENCRTKIDSILTAG
jgi:hypothetical protein